MIDGYPVNTVNPDEFVTTLPPFDRLTQAERACLGGTLLRQSFVGGDKVLKTGQIPDYLHIVETGKVQEYAVEGPLAVYAAGDCFDAQSLMARRSRHDYVALEDGSCLLLPREVFLDLTRSNPAFAGFYFESLSQKLDHMMAQENNRDLASFMMARIREAYIHPPLTVSADTSIHEAARQMQARKATSLLVERGHDIGICTGIDLRQAVIIERGSVDAPVGDVANYALISMQADDFLFNALLTMTRNDISRVVIREGERIVGTLEQMDLLSFFSNHSHLIALQIERATDRDTLKQASQNLISVIQTLQAKGVKIRHITQLVAELNKKVFIKLWQLLAPPELLANSCLLVMGSEGREEQILKTDQDNALILQDNYDHPELKHIARAFTDCLIDFGYPPCPGNIMLSNPYWNKSVSAYEKELSRWIRSPTEESFLQFAIFFDAMAVAGDHALLEQVRDAMYGMLQDHPIFYSHFAKAILAFDTPLSFFNAFVVGKKEHRDELDIKKGGIFPIVHGVRSLALEQRLRERNTIERIKALNERGLLERHSTVELIEAFAFMCGLRLKAGLRKQQLGLPPDNYLNPQELNKLERELLRDSFKIVNEFKKLIGHHFRLDLLG